jgi:amino acid transporter
LIVTPNQLTATAMILQYWVPPDEVNPGVWIVIFHVLIGIFNLIGVDYFGEIEFWLSAAKIFILTGLIIFMLILTCGGLPTYSIKVGL